MTDARKPDCPRSEGGFCIIAEVGGCNQITKGASTCGPLAEKFKADPDAFHLWRWRRAKRLARAAKLQRSGK